MSDISDSVIDLEVLLDAYLYISIKLYKSAKIGDSTNDI
jgi:hypothetical protein